ncbi:MULTISPECIES: 2-dehydropantoate 2-reductase [unclassified Acidiphilium]|jgi:2-dehydropantoate 2-reductase|uniref:2-dehydropantoate 2-reductase n=1 Tax=unclassified Acidiphilium TaxID=2617493 RepID=UPI000BD8AA7B|nr:MULTISPECIES: 2-dehydropantoate 2-reductase [unclassified Acidiphilium]OYV56060.1 MAG: 2-dehydropantoate 2-reductase [Acidiphilium sp. 20-67-58]HQT61199.1 2-dehydropantoate 2-reductase [Acidiphilium sp.]
MRILVVGAGGTGGYFGGRLAEAGLDVTFLVRPARAQALAAGGLVIRSVKGDVHLPAPSVVTADRLEPVFDLVLLSCKAYDLDDAVAAMAPAIGPHTLVLPLLNGMRHLDVLDARFGAPIVLGGQCVISAALDAEGRVLHLNDAHTLTFGPRASGQDARARTIAELFGRAGFVTRLSDAIMQDMWEKWVFIAALAGITCLMRAPVGVIVEAGGAEIALGLAAECAGIAARHGFELRPAASARLKEWLATRGSTMTASMLRDIEQGGRIEGAHIIGDLLRRGDPAACKLLAIADAHLRAYEIRRAG